MRKVGIILIVCLLAVAGITAAMAFHMASIESDAQLTVTSSDNALLALIPGGHANNPSTAKYSNASDTAWIGEDGRLYFDFAKGYEDGAGSYGVQPGSTYRWLRLFTVQNNSDENITVTIEVEDLPGKEVTVSDDGGTSFETTLVFELAPGAFKNICTKLETEKDAEMVTHIGEINVSAISDN